MQKPLYNVDGRRVTTADQPVLTQDELQNIEASELLIYENSEYQYHQEMRVKWEFFYNDKFYLDREVKQLILAQQQAFCERNRAERDQVKKLTRWILKVYYFPGINAFLSPRYQYFFFIQNQNISH